ncbi:MAG TPA: pyridoxal-dependent decarboxylase [Thermomicrobiales bacterium]|nr:pyridoxal-dependent decarboxylase [Thermomicrobiales bacterium]
MTQESNPFEEVAIAMDAAHAMAREVVLTFPTRPVALPVSAEAMNAAFDDSLPVDGVSASVALDEWMARAEPGIVATAGPRFFGWVFGGVTPGAIAGDWLISALDQQGSLWTANPASVQTEHAVVRWLKELFEIPADWVGTTTSGATMSNMVGLSAGRQWVGQQLGFDPALDGLAGNPVIPVVSSTEIHTSAIKALGHLGLGKRAIRKVAAPGGAIDLAAFERELASLDSPVLVVANAAEVNSGTFDDLSGMIDIARAHPKGAWVHVDGAFGLFARLSQRTRHLVEGVERADSIGSDAHKWLNVPYDSGFAFVRDRDALFGSFSNPAAYLAGNPVGLDFDVYIPEMSRRARGVAIWCAIKQMGLRGYQEMVDRCLDNAWSFAEWVEAEPGLELIAPAPLNIVCWRYTPEGLDEAATDQFNRDAVKAIQADGRAFVSGTVYRGHAGIRCAFDNWTTTLADVEILESAVRDVGETLRAG